MNFQSPDAGVSPTQSGGPKIELPTKPRILIVKMWAIGDVLLATPLLRALKRGYPGCKITWLVDKRYADVLEGNPLIDEVIAFDSGNWRAAFRRGKIASYLRISNVLVRDLKDRKFDVAINLAGEKWWAVWFNIAPIKIGLFPRPRVGVMGRLYTRAIPRNLNPRQHNSHHYLLPAEELGIPGPYEERIVIGIHEPGAKAAAEFLNARAGYDAKKPLIVLHPGASQESKRWPAKSFAEVADLLRDRYNIVITGSPSERPLAEEIASAMSSETPPIISSGALSGILETGALVQKAVAVVTGDTSILHIASALGTPVVAIYGSTRPGDNAPLYGSHRLLYGENIPCAPCYQANCRFQGEDRLRCLHTVTAEQVVSALNELLSETKAPSQDKVLT
jgi:lipopolysaccharide heptosyltransferase II